MPPEPDGALERAARYRVVRVDTRRRIDVGAQSPVETACPTASKFGTESPADSTLALEVFPAGPEDPLGLDRPVATARVDGNKRQGSVQVEIVLG